MRLFFYGTLRDPDVRRLVFGARAAALDVCPAELLGFRACRAEGADYPLLLRRTAARVRGELAEGLVYDDLLRLFHFEGPDYEPAQGLAIGPDGRRQAVWVLLPSGGRPASLRTWRLRSWQLQRKPRVLSQLKVWMREYERFEASSVEITWPVRRQLKAWRDAGELED